MKRGEVWWTELEPTVGREQRKARPCVIVSPPEIHDVLRIAIAAPLTTGSHPTPYRVPTSFGGKAGLVLLEQVRTFDRSRFQRRMGAMDAAEFDVVLETLQAIFAP